MLGNFNEESQFILLKSKEEMDNLNHPYIGTEHLLLSLLKNDSKISKKLGKSVRLVDAAEVLAEEVQTRLTNTHQLNKKGRGSLKIYASDAPSRFKRLAKHILGRELKQVYLKKLN